MKYVLLISIFILMGKITQAQSMPFDIVTYNFFREYKFDSYDNYLSFEKRKDGWYTVEHPYADPLKRENPQRFWSADKQQWLYDSITYPKVETPPTYNELLNLQESHYNLLGGSDAAKYLYDHNIYFGYAGWHWDVISEYGNKEEPLSDTICEALARAYSSYATGFIFNQWDDLFINGDKDREPLIDSQAVSANRIKKFIGYQNQAIEKYKKLVAINPFYETRVGAATIKLANEFMYTYSTLLFAGFVTEAKQYLPQNIYSDSLLTIARKNLNDVDKNGILITGGDNDTYPIWYLQQTENYRTDVLVLNYSLLGLKSYVGYIDKLTKGKLFATRSNIFWKKNFDVAVFDKQKEIRKEIELSDFIRLTNAKSLTQDKNEATRPIYNQSIVLKRKVAGSTNKKYEYGFKLGNYVFMNDYMLLDIFNTNIGKRNLFFTNRYVVDLFEELLSQKGSVYKVKEIFKLTTPIRNEEKAVKSVSGGE